VALIREVQAPNGCRQIRPIQPGCPALFLDRDGVIIADTGYIARCADVCLLLGAAEAIRTVNRLGWPVIVVSNQSGLGRGYFDLAALEAVQACIESRLSALGAYLDAVLICGAAPWDTGPAIAWRKPNPGMFYAARDLFGTDLPNSVMIGDRATDLIAARCAGVARRILLAEPGAKGADAATEIARDLSNAVISFVTPAVVAHG
jgi:D-glycero-D-manno-heptose 1,7-bisphosphate phosphatase